MGSGHFLQGQGRPCLQGAPVPPESQPLVPAPQPVHTACRGAPSHAALSVPRALDLQQALLPVFVASCSQRSRAGPADEDKVCASRAFVPCFEVAHPGHPQTGRARLQLLSGHSGPGSQWEKDTSSSGTGRRAVSGHQQTGSLGGGPNDGAPPAWESSSSKGVSPTPGPWRGERAQPPDALLGSSHGRPSGGCGQWLC